MFVHVFAHLSSDLPEINSSDEIGEQTGMYTVDFDNVFPTVLLYYLLTLYTDVR